MDDEDYDFDYEDSDQDQDDGQVDMENEYYTAKGEALSPLAAPSPLIPSSREEGGLVRDSCIRHTALFPVGCKTFLLGGKVQRCPWAARRRAPGLCFGREKERECFQRRSEGDGQDGSGKRSEASDAVDPHCRQPPGWKAAGSP
jgi:hypothetical protein